MKAFKIPPWRKKFINAKFREKDRLIDKTTAEMEKVLKTAVDFIVDNATPNGAFPVPPLDGMYEVTAQFYKNVIGKAFHTAKKEQRAMKNKRRLAKLPTGLPKNIESLDQIFKNPKYFKSIMKRSRILTDRLKRQYLRKLKRKFKEILPLLDSGEINASDVKEKMMGVWHASKPRAEVVFRTETTKYFADTQVNYFGSDEDIIGFLFDSVKDTSRTPICKSRHGLIYRLDSPLLRKNIPPCHYNCRSHLIALANTSENRRMLKESDRDPSRVKVVPLPRGWR